MTALEKTIETLRGRLAEVMKEIERMENRGIDYGDGEGNSAGAAA